MHFTSYADSCSCTVSYWKKAFHFLMYWSSAWSPEYLGFFSTEVLVSWALLHPSSSMRSWIEVSNLWMGWLGYYAHHIEESIGVLWILKRFCVFLMLVLELFGGKPQALSSGKTNMAMEYEAIFSKICWRWWFHIEKRWKLSPSLPFVDLPEIVSPSPHYSWVTTWW